MESLCRANNVPTVWGFFRAGQCEDYLPCVRLVSWGMKSSILNSYTIYGDIGSLATSLMTVSVSARHA